MAAPLDIERAAKRIAGPPGEEKRFRSELLRGAGREKYCTG
jgi:hypothetical protein